MLLAGDLGGTKADLALIDPQRGPDALLERTRLQSADFDDLPELVGHFRARCAKPMERACFGVAGPVSGGRARLTNLGWELSEPELAAALGLESVRLINDLAATAVALERLRPGESVTLQAGQPEPDGPIAVLAPGTGLGEGYAVSDGACRRAVGSEGGHADFAPLDVEGLDLLRYLWQRYDHVSYERVCSGIGLPELLAFLRDTGREAEPAWLSERLAAAADPNPVIAAAAARTEPPCPLARRALELFCRLLGAEAGNLALKVMATGGVYLAGGIPPRIRPWIEAGGFLEAFRAKGRFRDLMQRLPVLLVDAPDLALRGAALRVSALRVSDTGT